MTEISILVPVYNVEKYVGECLESILRQTFQDYEVICMDDGSTDRSGRLLDQYAAADKRIRVIHKSNDGYGKTMNRAMQLARGRYIGIVESDDAIEQDMFQAMHEAAVKFDLDMVKTDFYKTWQHEDGTEEKLYFPLIKDAGIYDRVIEPNRELQAYFLEKFTWNALYKREFLIENDIRYNETPGASYQDNGFWFQTFYWAKRTMFLDAAFYKYRQDNPGSSFRSKGKAYAMKSEFDYIHDFLVRNQEKNRGLYEICFHFRILGYLMTLNRIEDSLKLEFAEKICEECSLYEENGEAYYGWLSLNQREQLERIRKDPEEYAENMIAGNKKWAEAIAGFAHIIVYGAGARGKGVFAKVSRLALAEQEISLAVTSLAGKKEYHLSAAVHEIEEFVDERSSCLVVLAVKAGTDAFREMEENLNRLQFRNVIISEIFY